MTAAHAHDHARSAAGRHGRALAAAFALTAAFTIVELVAAIWTGSLALLADAGHMLTDVGGLGLALLAIWFAAKPPTPEKTYGYYRVEILAALVNAVLLLGIAAFILYEAYRRFWTPPEVRAVPMLVVAVAGLAANLGGLWLLHAGARESLNMRGAYLELVSDALGSVAVIISAVLVLTAGWNLADPLIGAGIGAFIIPRTWRLLRQAVDVLLESTPPHVNLAEVEAAMTSVPGVHQAHDLHVWTLTSGKYAMSGHVLVGNLSSGNEILRDLHALLHARFGIDHTTIQLESEPLIQIGSPGARPGPGRDPGGQPPPA